MITTPVNVSSGQAGDYYYFDKSKENAEWGGKLADEMQLAGKCTQEDFLKLTQGFNPNTDEKLTAHAGDPLRRAGADYTFTLGKNASVISFYDDRVRQAFNESVNETLKLAEERYAITRTQNAGIKTYEKTGNMLYTKFNHFDSRNNDPALHSHIFIHNITQDANKNLKSFEFKDMFSNKAYLGAIQESILSQKLINLGYQVETDRNKGISDISLQDKTIKDTFSSRQKEIDLKMAEIKERYPEKTEKEQRQIAQKETRQAKDHNSTIKEVKSNIEIKATKEQINNIKSEIQDAKANSKLQNINNIDLKPYSDEAVNNAIKDTSENSRYFKYENIENKALRKDFLKINTDSIKTSIADNKDLIQTKEGQYTTKEIQGIVNNNIKTIKTNETIKPPADKTQIDKAIKDYEIANNRILTQGQKEAVNLMKDNYKINVIQGDAGTGKTTSFKIIKEIGEANGYKVIGIAPTGKATKELKEAGIKETYTIKGLQDNNIKIDSKTILIADESSMIGDKQAKFVLSQQSHKTIFAGDLKQFRSIERGEFFKEAQANINKSSFVNMQEAMRFKTEHQKELAGHIANKNYTNALNNLEKNNNIKSFKTTDEKMQAITNNYIDGKLAGKNIIVIAETNAQKDTANEKIRQGLIDKGIIDNNKGMVITAHTQKNLDATAKGFSESYKKGDYLYFNNNQKLDNNIYFSKGSKAEIINISGDNLLLKGIATGTYTADNKFNTIKQKGEYEIKLNDINKNNFSVYSKKEIDLSKNDEIVFLKNDKNLDVKNGETGMIKEIDADNKIIKVEMKNGQEKDINTDKYNNIDYGYTLTNYKSQGATVNETMYIAGEQTTSEQAFYVAGTRATDNTAIYGTDKEIENFTNNIKDFETKQEIETPDKELQPEQELKGIIPEQEIKIDIEPILEEILHY